ncbi:MAG: hypothetical protein C0487_06520 [Leptothrix sp. (in: Bacteria)]|nr:hypothetical protein [Leptothrix sp. (in: b-proteobacteria)]
MNTSLAVFVALAGVATLLVALTLCRPMLGEKTMAAAPDTGGRRMATVAALVIPMLATSLYALLGAPRTLLIEPVAAVHRMNSGDMTQATERLARKLQDAPDDLEAWFVLARSYQAMEKWRKSAAAYRQALRLAPDDPQLMADLADVLASAQGGKLEGEPMQWIVQALRADPQHLKGRALAAMAAYRAGRFDEARFHWEKLAALSEPGSEGTELARQGIARIKDSAPRTSQQQLTKATRPAIKD